MFFMVECLLSIIISTNRLRSSLEDEIELSKGSERSLGLFKL